MDEQFPFSLIGLLLHFVFSSDAYKIDCEPLSEFGSDIIIYIELQMPFESQSCFPKRSFHHS